MKTRVLTTPAHPNRSMARPAPTRRLARLQRMLGTVVACLSILAAAPVSAAQPAVPQTIALGASSVAGPAGGTASAGGYSFMVYANHDLSPPSAQPIQISRAVVFVHGVRRNAVDYFALGQRLLRLAQWPDSDTLLIAPHFMTRTDATAASATAPLPLWGQDSWMQGAASRHGVTGITSFQTLDDLVHWLADRQRFPALREIVLIGHSAGAQLMQRYAMVNALEPFLQQAGVAIRYVISSPSSYLYPSADRPQAEGFAPPGAAECPDYDHYRYGLENPPPYLARQQLSAQQLFKRYAARHITYLVGARDVDPQHRFLDRSCAAQWQGANRLERQHQFVRLEQLLAARWQVPLQHTQFDVPDAAHGAERLYGSAETARRILPP